MVREMAKKDSVPREISTRKGSSQAVGLSQGCNFQRGARAGLRGLDSQKPTILGTGATVWAPALLRQVRVAAGSDVSGIRDNLRCVMCAFLARIAS